ncbi:hypothetical protein GCM10009121_02580 [Rhodanobacter soli]
MKAAAIALTPRRRAWRLIGDLQREANGGSLHSRNERFSPELVVRGSTAPSGRSTGTRRKPAT